jgi:DNA replication and repair protein RecF
VAVHRLDLSNFRCHRDARIEADGRPVVLTGANGAGKTNVLEAVSFLAPGRGLRRARLVEVDYDAALCGGSAAGGTETAWAVSARVETAGGVVAIGTGRDPAGESGDRRIVRIDGQTVKGQAALGRFLHLVWLTPQMDRLFQEGAAPRRRFLDRLVFAFDPDHATRLTAYEQTLRERVRLLRQGGDAAWIGQLEQSMAETGVAIAAARRDVTARLDAIAGERPTGRFPVPRLAVAGTPELWLDTLPSLGAEERLRAELAANRRLDAEAGGAITGPHRSDLIVRDAGRDIAAARCSTGEQKALLVALVLAHARLQVDLRGTLPVVLLDEVIAHLDAGRRAALFETILGLGAQAWMTGTDAPLFAELAGAAQFFTVAGGAIAPG